MKPTSDTQALAHFLAAILVVGKKIGTFWCYLRRISSHRREIAALVEQLLTFD